MTPRRPDSRKSGRFTVAPNRFWTSADGRRWRVWLEQPPQHMFRADARPALTFVAMSGPGQQRQIVRTVPLGTELEELGDEELERVLAERVY